MIVLQKTNSQVRVKRYQSVFGKEIKGEIKILLCKQFMATFVYNSIDTYTCLLMFYEIISKTYLTSDRIW